MNFNIDLLGENFTYFINYLSANIFVNSSVIREINFEKVRALYNKIENSNQKTIVILYERNSGLTTFLNFINCYELYFKSDIKNYIVLNSEASIGYSKRMSENILSDFAVILKSFIVKNIKREKKEIKIDTNNNKYFGFPSCDQLELLSKPDFISVTKLIMDNCSTIFFDESKFCKIYENLVHKTNENFKAIIVLSIDDFDYKRFLNKLKIEKINFEKIELKKI